MSANPVLAACERLRHGDYPDDLTEEQRIARLAEDANLVAGDYELMWRDLSKSNELIGRTIAALRMRGHGSQLEIDIDAQHRANQRRLGLARAEGDK